jgi:alcohol dehydrogenase class IV
MLKAANFSGMAINIAKTNTPHALSYFFTSRFKIPHGIAVSIFFIEVINFYYFSGKKNNNLDILKRFNLFFKVFLILKMYLYLILVLSNK